MPRRWRSFWGLAGLLPLGLLLGQLVGQPDESAPAPPPAISINGQPLPAEVIAAGAEQRAGARAYETAVLAELIRQAADGAEVWPTATETETALADLVATTFDGDDARYRAWLAEGGRDEATLRAEVATQLAAFRLRTKDAQISDEDLRTYYDEHRDAYRRSARFTYRIIHLPWPTRDGRPVTDEEARRTAERELGRIRTPADFPAAAARLSIDPDGERLGGRVGPVPAELLPPEFLAPFADAQPDQIITHPVRLDQRYVLLQFLHLQPAVEGTFEQVRAQVRADLVRGQLQPQEAFLTSLLKDAKIDAGTSRYAGVPLTPTWTSPSGLSAPGWLR
ncbi:MAG TPA: hypothetical protein DCZ72_05640 [Armatimonadetes bacterium]|nr:hypothetical protein [Armatimonadota bacterium]